MAISFEPTAEQRANQHEIIKAVFNLTDDHKVLRDWSMESAGDSALVTVTLFEFVSLDVANELINGEPHDNSLGITPM